jgi:hypothetical protein
MFDKDEMNLGNVSVNKTVVDYEEDERVTKNDLKHP